MTVHLLGVGATIYRFGLPCQSLHTKAWNAGGHMQVSVRLVEAFTPNPGILVGMRAIRKHYGR